jgi:hypothetical protein
MWTGMAPMCRSRVSSCLSRRRDRVEVCEAPDTLRRTRSEGGRDGSIHHCRCPTTSLPRHRSRRSSTPRPCSTTSSHRCRRLASSPRSPDTPRNSRLRSCRRRRACRRPHLHSRSGSSTRTGATQGRSSRCRKPTRRRVQRNSGGLGNPCRRRERRAARSVRTPEWVRQRRARPLRPQQQGRQHRRAVSRIHSRQPETGRVTSCSAIGSGFPRRPRIPPVVAYVSGPLRLYVPSPSGSIHVNANAPYLCPHRRY